MKRILELIFPALRGVAVKINRDHLPGLKPPKASAYKPVPPIRNRQPQGPSIEDYYRRFKASGGAKPSARRLDDGMGF